MPLTVREQTAECVQKMRVGIVLQGRFGVLSLVTFNSCWKAHLPCLEGGTSPYPGSISVYFAYKGSEKGGRGAQPLVPPA